MPRVLVPLAEGCEELEAVSIIDILRRGGVEVVVAALEDGPVTASRGVRLCADTTLDQVGDQDFDMVVLPGGGPGSDRLRADERIAALLKRHARLDRYTAAICAAPKVLAAAGLLDGKRATGYPGVLEALDLPATEVLRQVVVSDGKVITSQGPGTAMDFALHLVETLQGADVRERVERGLRPGFD